MSQYLPFYKTWMAALSGMPHLTGQQWQALGWFSRWLVASRAAVLIMTFTSAALGGILAVGQPGSDFGNWLICVLGLCLAHATNNLINDVTDYLKGVDKGNYFRTQYGVQTLESGLLSMRAMLAYVAVTGVLALCCALYLYWKLGESVLWLTVAGAFFVLFYTWPLKYIGMGEPAVWVVWGPLMVGGTYFVVTGNWSFEALAVGGVYALGPTAVLFGKHIDKLSADQGKGVRTLPVILGESVSRQVVLWLVYLQLAAMVALVLTGVLGFAALLVLVALPAVIRMRRVYAENKPTHPPEGFPEKVWPLWYVAYGFSYMRRFSLALLAGLLLNVLLFGRP